MSDRYAQRAIIVTAAATRFGSGVVMGTAFAVLIERAGGSAFAVSLLFPAYFVGLLVFAPAWGAVADVTGRRRAVLVATGTLATLTLVPLIVVDGIAALIGVRAMYAVFAAGFPPVMLATMSDLGGESARGRALGFFNSARAVGFTGGQLAAGTLLGLLVPSELYGVVAALSVTSTLAVVFLATDDHGPNSRSASLREITVAVRKRLLPGRADRRHLKTNGLQWLYVALALRNMTVMGIMSLMPVYLTAELGLPDVLMGVVLAVNPIIQIGGMTVFGRLADRSGRRPFIVLGMAGAGVFAILAGVAHAPSGVAGRLAIAVIASGVIGLAFSAMTTGALAFIGDVSPVHRESELMGFRTTAKGVGAVIGAPLVGGMATIIGYSPTFYLVSVLAFLAAVIASRQLVEPERRATRAGVPESG